MEDMSSERGNSWTNATSESWPWLRWIPSEGSKGSRLAASRLGLMGNAKTSSSDSDSRCSSKSFLSGVIDSDSSDSSEATSLALEESVELADIDDGEQGLSSM